MYQTPTPETIIAHLHREGKLNFLTTQGRGQNEEAMRPPTHTVRMLNVVEFAGEPSGDGAAKCAERHRLQ